MVSGDFSQKHVSVRIGAVPNVNNPLTQTPPPPYTTNSTTSPIHHQLGHISTTHTLANCSCCSLPCVRSSADWAYIKGQRTSDNVSDLGFNNAAQEARKQISIHQSPHSAVRQRIHRARRRIHQARRRKYQPASPSPNERCWKGL